MDRVIEIAEGDVIELHVRVTEPQRGEDTEGFAYTSDGSRTPGTLPIGLPPIRLAVVRNPHPGPPIEATQAHDLQGFMMKADIRPEPLNLNNGSPGGPAPIGLLFEWVSDPIGTTLKVWSKSY